MIFILSILALSVLIGFVRGGRLQLNLQLKHVWTAPLALSLQVATMLIPGTAAALVIMIVSYSLLLYCLVINHEHQSLRVLLLGVLLNFIVIAANGGRIPVDMDVARQVGVDVQAVLDGTDFKHAAITESSRLTFLGDVIPLPAPISKVASIGDVVVFVGLFLLIQDLMGKRVHISLGPGE